MAQLEILKIDYKTPEWYAFRKQGLGGSDAAAAIGRSNLKSNTELWAEKTGRAEPRDISDNPRVIYGINAEEYITRMFALDYPQYTLHDTKGVMYRRGFLFASLDGLLTDNATGETGVLEIKTSTIDSRAAADKWDDNKVPEQYYIQVVHYMLVTGATFAIIKARLIDRDRYGEITIREKHYRYNRADVLGDMKYLYSAEKRFWKYVEADKRPPAILPDI